MKQLTTSFTFIALALIISAHATESVFKNARTVDELSNEVRNALNVAIKKTRSNLTRKEPNASKPLVDFCNAYKKTTSSHTGIPISAMLTADEPRTHALVQGICLNRGNETLDNKSISEHGKLSNTEKDAMGAANRLKENDLQGAIRICTDIARRGQTATYHDEASKSGAKIKLSREISCAACRAVFEGADPSNPEHRRALEASCTKAQS